MWWPFKKEEPIKNPEEVLEGLKKSQDLLNERFSKKLVSNEVYLAKMKEIGKKIDKCQKQINESN